jgi:CO dehydrogenase/acetyl-CoA synthase delta subunit
MQRHETVAAAHTIDWAKKLVAKAKTRLSTVFNTSTVPSVRTNTSEPVRNKVPFW